MAKRQRTGRGNPNGFKRKVEQFPGGGRPKPALPFKLTKQLGLGEAATADDTASYSEDQDEVVPDEPADAGPGNSTRAYQPGGGTRAQGGGGLYGISKRKAERKAAAAAAKQRSAEHAQRVREAKAARLKAQQQAKQERQRNQPQAAHTKPIQGKHAQQEAATASQQQGRQPQQQQLQQQGKRKRDGTAAPQQKGGKAAKFEEFLGDLVVSGNEAIEAEKRRYKEVMRKLKSRRGNVAKLDDGLDDLTAGLTAAAMESGSEESADGGSDSELEGETSESASEDDLTSQQSFEDMPASSVEPSDVGSSEPSGEESGSEEAASDLASESDAGSQGDSDAGSLDSGQQPGRYAAPQGATTGQAYVPPALRKQQDGLGQVEQHVRGLLNRLAESNLPGIAGQVVDLMPDAGRGTVSNVINSELLTAAAEGPRASEAFAAVTAAFVAGVSAMANAQEVAARFLADLAQRLSDARQQQESLACHNLMMVAVHAYLCGMMGPTVMYSLLDHLRQRFEEQDVAMMSTALRAAGLHLRAADPAAMKDFLVAVHARAAEASASGAMSTRAEVMLSLLMDIKNNKMKGGAVNVVLTAGTAKWLKSVGAAQIALHNLTWDKLLSPNKKGLWWLPAAGEVLPDSGATPNLASVAAGADLELLRLAAAARMNTDVRRAAFCCVMGAEDATDGFERLLRLGLKGEAERELVRVPVECCLQEKAWNAYYALLLGRLVAAASSHGITLQYCLWDHFKELAGMEARRAAHLARLTAALVSAGTLPLSILKVVRFELTMSAREQLFWNLTLEHLLLGCQDDSTVAAVFGRLAGNASLKALQTSLQLYLKRTFLPWAQHRLQGKKQKAHATLVRRLDTASHKLAVRSV